jgi:hypothetical protein
VPSPAELAELRLRAIHALHRSDRNPDEQTPLPLPKDPAQALRELREIERSEARAYSSTAGLQALARTLRDERPDLLAEIAATRARKPSFWLRVRIALGWA